ncbi:MAG: hypothetical protein IH623_18075 [Verrucomicrobia bacterium]|nr:hypothetical protein [Verrucomicrobiota bacterium]
MKQRIVIAAWVATGALLSVVGLKQIAVPGETSSPPKSTPQVIVRKEMQLRSLPPGSYLTLPYACILIVPPADLDAEFVLKNPPKNFPMPILKPKLEVIPLTSGTK